MDASRLLTVMNILEQEFASGYEANLNEFIQVYTQARDNPGQDFGPTIEASRAKLERLLEQSVTNEFVPSRRRMLVQLEAQDLFGLGALGRIRAAMQSSVSGLAGVVKILEGFKSELSRFRQSINQVQEGLAALGIGPDELGPSEHEIGVLVPERMTDGKLNALKDQIEEWNRILRTLAEVAGEEDREVNVRALVSNTFEFYVVAGIVTAGMMAKIIDRVTEWYKRILEIQILRKQLAKLDAPPVETKVIEDHESARLGKLIGQLVGELLEDSPADLDSGRRNELRVQLTVSVRKIVRFVDAGGDVEVSKPEFVEEELQPPTDDKGQLKPQNEIEAAKAGWKTLQEESRRSWDLLRRQGAAAAGLPERPEPILQLPDEAVGPEDEEQKPGKKRKT